MDDFEIPLPGEYDDISRYEDEYADDFDALNDFEGEYEMINFLEKGKAWQKWVKHQTGNFVLCTQYLAHAATYVVFNLSHTVGNKQRIYCCNLLFSTTNFPNGLA